MPDSPGLCLPSLGPTDKGAVAVWDGERWNTSPGGAAEGSVFTMGANGEPYWAAPSFGLKQASGTEKGPKPRELPDLDKKQPM